MSLTAAVGVAARDGLVWRECEPGVEVAKLGDAHTVSVGSTHRGIALLKGQRIIGVGRVRCAVVSADRPTGWTSVGP